MLDKSKKIIVVGAGCNGLATTLSLLQQGYSDVHLFDKRDYFTQEYNYLKGCDSPSSDFNKFFRAAYGNELHYQNMALRSREVVVKWNKMIKDENWEGGEPLFFDTGNVHLTDQLQPEPFQQATIKSMGPDKCICLGDSDAAERAAKVGISPVSVDPFRMKERGVHLQGILDTEGGTILADKSCRWMLHLCQVTGGDRLTIHFGLEAGQVDHLLEEYRETGAKKCVGIKTMDGKVHLAPLTVCACGPWLTHVVPESQEKLEATAGTVVLIKITDKKALEKYNQKVFPTWSYKIKAGAMGDVYGFPVRDGWMKMGFRGLKWTNPQPGYNSKIVTRWSAPDTQLQVPLFGLKLIKQFIKTNIPEVAKIDLTRLCWYGDSEDNDWLIDYSPYHENDSLFVIGGDSGHSFKMLATVGDTIVDIINRRGDKFFANLFSWTRERQKLNIINKGVADPRALCNQKMATDKDLYIYGDSKL